jgi:predicted RNA-binding Zn-ribbon protein involved in translation (DUF1610 family)
MTDNETIHAICPRCGHYWHETCDRPEGEGHHCAECGADLRVTTDEVSA